MVLGDQRTHETKLEAVYPMPSSTVQSILGDLKLSDSSSTCRGPAEGMHGAAAPEELSWPDGDWRAVHPFIQGRSSQHFKGNCKF